MIKRKDYLALCAVLGVCHYTHAAPDSLEIDIAGSSQTTRSSKNTRNSYFSLSGLSPQGCPLLEISSLLQRVHAVLSNKSGSPVSDDCNYLRSAMSLLTLKEITRIQEWCKEQGESNEDIKQLSERCAEEQSGKKHDDMIIAMSRVLQCRNLKSLDPALHGNKMILDMGEDIGKIIIPEFIQDLLLHAVPDIKNSKNAQDKIANNITTMLIEGKCELAVDKTNEYVVTISKKDKEIYESFVSCVQENAYHPLVSRAAISILLEAFASKRCCCKTSTWHQRSSAQRMSLNNLDQLDWLLISLEDAAIDLDLEYKNALLVRNQNTACINKRKRYNSCAKATCVILPTATLVALTGAAFVYKINSIVESKTDFVPSFVNNENDSNISNTSNASTTTTSATERLHSWQYLMQLAINQTDHQSLAVTLADPVWNWQSGIQCPAILEAFNGSVVSVPAQINGALGSYNISVEQMLLGAECAKDAKKEWSQYSCKEVQTAQKDTMLAQGHLLNPALFGDFFTLHNGTFAANMKALRPLMDSSAFLESNVRALNICNASCKDNTVFENPCAEYVQADSKSILHNIYREDGLLQRIMSVMLWTVERKCDTGFTDIKYIAPVQSGSKVFSNAHNTAQGYIEALVSNNSNVKDCVKKDPAIAEELTELLRTKTQTTIA